MLPDGTSDARNGTLASAAVASAPASKKKKTRRRRVVRPAVVNSKGANAKVASLAARQHGLITRAQAIALGMSSTSVKARVRSGRWERLGRGVYALAGTPDTRERKILAACLTAGSEAVATGYAAAELHGLPKIRRGQPIAIAVTTGSRAACPKRKAIAAYEKLTKAKKPAPFPKWPYEVHHRGYLSRPGVRVAQKNVPVASIAWTYVELARHVPDKVLGYSVAEAVRRGLVTVGELAAAVLASGAQQHVEKLRRILSGPAMKDAYRSEAEIIVADHLREEGYDDLEMNHEFRRAGVRVGEPDARSQAAMLIVEVDGPGHDTEEQRSIDSIQTRCYEALGYAVVRMRPEQVGSRWRLRTMIAAAQARRRKTPATPSEFLALWRKLTEGLPATHIPSQEELPSVYAKYL